MRSLPKWVPLLYSAGSMISQTRGLRSVVWMYPEPCIGSLDKFCLYIKIILEQGAEAKIIKIRLEIQASQNPIYTVVPVEVNHDTKRKRSESLCQSSTIGS